MSFLEIANKRTSIRCYSTESIHEEDILQMIRAACSAPSAGNCQPWYFYIIFDKEVICNIGDTVYMHDWIKDAPSIIAVCADEKLSENKYGDRGKELYCIQDTAAAIENILLCADDLGYGACWIGDFNEDKLRTVIDIKPTSRPVALIPVGKTNMPRIKPARRPLEDTFTIIGKQSETYHEQNTDNPNKFQHCNLEGAIFEDVNLGSSKFNNINFYNTQISDANLSTVKIQYCNLMNLEISDCKIDGLTINGIDVSKLI